LKKMLKKPNPDVQAPDIKALARLRVTIPREYLLPLFTVPRMEVAGPAVALLCGKKTFPARKTLPLLQKRYEPWHAGCH
jgi:hypothetical protein